MTYRKKLIEVVLPGGYQQGRGAGEIDPPQGIPAPCTSGGRGAPLAAARAVIFAQMADDPSTYVDLLRGDAKRRRKAESLLKGRPFVQEDRLRQRRKGQSQTGDAARNLPMAGPQKHLNIHADNLGNVV